MKIFIFGHSNEGEGPYYALTEYGKLVGEHFCSSSGWAIQDLGMVPGTFQDSRLQEYAIQTNRKPEDFVFEYVESRHIRQHTKLMEAITSFKRTADRLTKVVDDSEEAEEQVHVQ